MSQLHKVKFSCFTFVSCCHCCDLRWLNKLIVISSHSAAPQQQTVVLFTEKHHRRKMCWPSDLASACISISVYYLTRSPLGSSFGVRVQMRWKKEVCWDVISKAKLGSSISVCSSESQSIFSCTARQLFPFVFVLSVWSNPSEAVQMAQMHARSLQ